MDAILASMGDGMPFKSEKQRRYLYAKKPKVAKEFARKTSKHARLPESAEKENFRRYMKKKKKS